MHCSHSRPAVKHGQCYKLSSEKVSEVPCLLDTEVLFITNLPKAANVKYLKNDGILNSAVGCASGMSRSGEVIIGQHQASLCSSVVIWILYPASSQSVRTHPATVFKGAKIVLIFLIHMYIEAKGLRHTPRLDVFE